MFRGRLACFPSRTLTASRSASALRYAGLAPRIQRAPVVRAQSTADPLYEYATIGTGFFPACLSAFSAPDPYPCVRIASGCNLLVREAAGDEHEHAEFPLGEVGELGRLRRAGWRAPDE